ncbi:MAG: nitrate/nitrite transporter [Pseudomonadales bacterium]
MTRHTAKVRHWLVMAVLGLAGGVIFLLPFFQEVYYKPLSSALSLNNTEVGSLLSAFGVTAMLSYFPGGWLADQVSSRKLISSSLLITGALGVYFSSFPSYQISLLIHAAWGVSISLLFWGAMIRATRHWAPSGEQGKAFGVLETGRGVSEGLASVALLSIFGWLGSTEQALSIVVLQCSILILLLGVVSWFVFDDDNAVGEDTEEHAKIDLKDVLELLRMPEVWLISLIVLTGYSAYWGTFRLTPYASDVFLMSVTAAGVMSVSKMFLKPLAALIAGLTADKIGVAKTIGIIFTLMMVSFAVFAFLPSSANLLPLMLLNVAVISIGVFAMRGIYFALLDEGGIPLKVTGTAAGIVSVLGFTPDIFMPLLGGVLIDQFPGQQGYQYFFMTTAAICLIGLLATVCLYKRYIVPRSPR